MGTRIFNTMDDFCDEVYTDALGTKFACILMKGHKGDHYSGGVDCGIEWQAASDVMVPAKYLPTKGDDT